MTALVQLFQGVPPDHVHTGRFSVLSSDDSTWCSGGLHITGYGRVHEADTVEPTSPTDRYKSVCLACMVMAKRWVYLECVSV